MKKTITIVAVLAAALCTTARADETSGLSVGLRSSYAIPLGSAADGSALNDLTKGAIPFQLDVGWRFDPHWLAGAYFAWGPALVADAGKRALQASGASDVRGHYQQRLGIQGIYTFSPDQRLAPWAGLGLGYEWTRFAQAKVDGNETEIGLAGFEASLQLGGDYRVSRRFVVGPFASVSFGRYDSYTSWTQHQGSSDSSVNDKGIHEWIQLGVKGSFGL
jgi:hypothetical protein